MEEHELCVICLGEAHHVGACQTCQNFTAKVKVDRAARLTAILAATNPAAKVSVGGNQPNLPPPSPHSHQD